MWWGRGGGWRPCGSCRSLSDLHLAVVSRATGPQDAVAAPAGQAQLGPVAQAHEHLLAELDEQVDRKSTRLNSSHVKISYAVFCLKKKKKKNKKTNQEKIKLKTKYKTSC